MCAGRALNQLVFRWMDTAVDREGLALARSTVWSIRGEKEGGTSSTAHVMYSACITHYCSSNGFAVRSFLVLVSLLRPLTQHDLSVHVCVQCALKYASSRSPRWNFMFSHLLRSTKTGPPFPDRRVGRDLSTLVTQGHPLQGTRRDESRGCVPIPRRVPVSRSDVL